MPVFSSPLSPGFWPAAAREVSQLRKLVFAALMIAAAIALGLFRIPVSEGLNLSVSYVARALCAAVCGPVLGMLYGVAEDILGWVVHPGGAFFPGYTLNTVLAMLAYSLCLYRQKITLWRVVLAKLVTNYPISVGLGCLWSSILYGKAYMVYLPVSLLKNALYLPFQVLLLYMTLSALAPALQQSGLLAPGTEPRRFDA